MKKIKVAIFTILLIGLAYFAYSKVAEFIAIDKCLDKGFRWDYSLNECQCLNKSEQDNNEHLIIKDKCAVIYNPDSIKILAAKKIDEENFYVSADDAMFYISESRDFLKSKKVKIIETESRIIDFKTKDKLLKTINLNSDDKFWGIILFDGKNIPVGIDMTDIKMEFEKHIK
jgi:outer membrane lipoprotein-sorting protein